MAADSPEAALEQAADGDDEVIGRDVSLAVFEASGDPERVDGEGA